MYGMNDPPRVAVFGDWRTRSVSPAWRHAPPPARGRQRLQENFALAETQDITWSNLGLRHPPAIHEGAVGGAKVRHEHAAVVRDQHRVSTRHRVIAENEVARARAS